MPHYVKHINLKTVFMSNRLMNAIMGNSEWNLQKLVWWFGALVTPASHTPTPVLWEVSKPLSDAFSTYGYFAGDSAERICRQRRRLTCRDSFPHRLAAAHCPALFWVVGRTTLSFVKAVLLVLPFLKHESLHWKGCFSLAHILALRFQAHQPSETRIQTSTCKCCYHLL